MRATSRRDDQNQRGSVIIVAMLSMVGLITVGGMSALATRSGTRASAHDRFRTQALYAAESGIAAGMNYLRVKIDATTKWSSLVNADNSPLIAPDSTFTSNDKTTEATGNLLTDETLSHFKIEILNNEDDPQFSAGTDSDGVVILRSTGYGPNNTTVVLMVEVRENGVNDLEAGRPCPNYAQEGLAEDGSGRNDCLKNVNNSITTYSPGS